MSPQLLAASRRRYVSLTTFRRSGEGVATAVWIAPAPDGAVVLTGAGSGKAKRLRRDQRVELRECDARGQVKPGAPVVHGRAETVVDPAEQDRLLDGHRRKYGLQFRAFRLVEHLATRGEGPGDLVLRIVDA